MKRPPRSQPLPSKNERRVEAQPEETGEGASKSPSQRSSQWLSDGCDKLIRSGPGPTSRHLVTPAHFTRETFSLCITKKVSVKALGLRNAFDCRRKCSLALMGLTELEVA